MVPRAGAIEMGLVSEIDRVVCINLDRHPERWESFTAQIGRIGADWPFGSVERVAGIDGRELECPDWWDAGPGAWGILQTLLGVFRAALEDGVKGLLVFEDDAVFPADFPRQVGEFIEHVPDDWEGLYFGGEHMFSDLRPPVLVNEHVLRCTNVSRAHAMVLRGEYLQMAYHYCSDMKDWSRYRGFHVDHRLGVLHETGRYNIYAPVRWLVGQAAGQSDISMRMEELRFWNDQSASLCCSCLRVYITDLPYYRSLNRPDWYVFIRMAYCSGE